MKLPGPGWLTLFAVVLFSATGCAIFQKRLPAPQPVANWKTVAGQVRYQTPERTIVADATVRVGKNAREYSAEISKAGVVLLKLDRAETLGWASGPLAYFGFQGAVEKAPAKLQPWFRETTAALENQSPGISAHSEIQIEYRLQK